MQPINALSLAPDGNDWLAISRHPRILHVFDHVCNLINEQREILSIVTLQIGNGPFNLVVDSDLLFFDHLHAQSPISIRPDQIHLGDLTINTSDAKFWSPRPDWERLHTKKDDILYQLASLPIVNYRPSLPNSLLTNLSTAIAVVDLPCSLATTCQLAGLGQGLTPAGDDFTLGAVLAAWVIHPREIACDLAKEVTNIAAPLTTSLSAAWLRSAGKGEAGILWHHYFDALISEDPLHIQEATDKILVVGETSGADALIGFISVFISWMKFQEKEIAVYEDPSG